MNASSQYDYGCHFDGYILSKLSVVIYHNIQPAGGHNSSMVETKTGILFDQLTVRDCYFYLLFTHLAYPTTSTIGFLSASDDLYSARHH